MSQLTRREFLKLCGTSSIGLALAACGVTPTPTATPAPTSTALPTSTPLPTATATLTNTLAPTSTATVSPTAIPTPTPQPLTLRTVGKKLGIVIGTISDGADDWRNPAYQKTLGTHFHSMMTSGQIMPHNIEKGGWQTASRFRDIADKLNMILHLHPGFWPRYFPQNLRTASDEQVMKWTIERIDNLLNFVRRVEDGYQPTFVNYVNEAVYYSIRFKKARWYTEEDNPLYRVFREEWISEVYTMMYRMAEQRGLKVGKDLILIYNDGLLKTERNAPRFTYDVLIKAKQEIASKLVVPLERVKLDVGIQLHLSLNPEQDISYVVPPTDKELSDTIALFSDIGRIHLTEFDVKGATPHHWMEIVTRVFRIALLSGRCDSINLWNTFRFKIYQPNEFDYGPNGLFNPDYTPTETYYSLVRVLSEM